MDLTRRYPETPLEAARMLVDIASDLCDDIHEIAAGRSQQDEASRSMTPEELKAALDSIVKTLADGDYKKLDIKAMLKEQGYGIRLAHIIVEKTGREEGNDIE